MEHQQWKVQYVRKKPVSSTPKGPHVSKKAKALLTNHETGARSTNHSSTVSPMAIAQARQASGMTQAELAKKLQVTKQVVQQWEKGTKHPEGRDKARLKRLLSKI